MNSLTLTLRSENIQSSYFAVSLTTSTDTNNDSTSTQERSVGLPHDNVPAKDAVI